MKNFTLTFSEAELETIANAMEDYMQYDDEKLNTEFLFGGLSVADRVDSIQNKIDEVFKPASWAAPAKHVRYDLRIIREREFLFNSNNTDWAGGYLYLR